MAKERNSGLDLLRLLAGIAVIMLHYNYGYAFSVIDNLPASNRVILYALETLCVPAVNVFILISGYFLFRTDKRSIGKVLNLLILVIFIREFYYLGMVSLGKLPFQWGKFFQYLIPRCYFVILYGALYLLSPYINIIIRSLSGNSLKYLLLLICVILSIEPWFVDIMQKATTYDWRGISMISFNGGDGGQTLIHFTFMYILGACINKLGEEVNHYVCLEGGVFIVSSIVVFLGITKFSLWFEVSYYNPFVVLQSLSLFSLFQNVKCHKIISIFSKAALVCYVIHPYLLQFLNIKIYANQPFYILITHIVVSLIGIYMVSFVFMIVYDFVFKKPIGYLNNIKTNYFL